MKHQQSIVNSVRFNSSKNKKQHRGEDVTLTENQPQNKNLSNEKIITTKNNSKYHASGYNSSWVKRIPRHIMKKDLKDNATGNHLNFLVIKQI